MQTTTIIARSPSALLRHLHVLSLTATGTLLFALSHNVEPNSLSSLVKRLTTLTSSTLGCLSAPLVPKHVSCSLAFLPSETGAVPFRSSIPGREAPQVGRWHKFRYKDSDTNTGPPREFSSWADVWAGTKTQARETLPLSLQGLSKDPTGIVYFSDKAPEGLLSALNAFPGTSSLGLIASSTPFITGRPVTLFHNDAIYSDGALGVALTTPLTPPKTGFEGARPISPRMTITEREGNMINALDDSNPAQLLLTAIRKSGMDMDAAGSFKDDETFLLGTENPTVMYRITAGDPSRGFISIEPQNVAPPVGTAVQYFHLPKAALKQGHEPLSGRRSGFELFACSEAMTDIAADGDGSEPGARMGLWFDEEEMRMRGHVRLEEDL
ncbi:hypothetical protein H0H92_011244 [Tricholoma furcatifolium]|nr:hypothetical protein H0H92_011244 [Tricholoma furcatifolium]